MVNYFNAMSHNEKFFSRLYKDNDKKIVRYIIAKISANITNKNFLILDKNLEKDLYLYFNNDTPINSARSYNFGMVFSEAINQLKNLLQNEKHFKYIKINKHIRVNTTNEKDISKISAILDFKDKNFIFLSYEKEIKKAYKFSKLFDQ